MRILFLLIFTVACGMEQGKVPKQATSSKMSKTSSISGTVCVHMIACSQDCQNQSKQCYGACTGLSETETSSCREKCEQTESACMKKMVTMDEKTMQDNFVHPL